MHCGGDGYLLHPHSKDAFMQRSLLTITLVLFGALSAVALWQHGYWGLFAPAFRALPRARFSRTWSSR